MHFTLWLILQALFIAALANVLWTLLFSPLRQIPGPFLAKFTDLWRLLSTLSRQPEIAQRKLHDRLGPVVRLGPNMVSVSDPGMIREIYSRKTVLIKGDFYMPHDLNVQGQRVPNLFSTRDEQMNSRALKPVSKYFSMGYVVKIEPLIDRTIGVFLDELRKRFVERSSQCDIDNWLHYCAWDVIADITWSKPLGFLKHGADVGSMLAVNNAALDYVSVVGMMPWLDYCFERNPIRRVGPPSYNAATSFTLERIAERRFGRDSHDKSAFDMLDGFIEAREDNPQEVPEESLMAYVFAGVVAGSDTVAAELRAIVYYLCKNRVALLKLQKELDDAGVSTPIPWSECQKLPYLCACISEGMRILPGAALPLERRVGPGGLVVEGQDGQVVLPPDTLVGINPYVINRDKGVFGVDSDQYRPERWLRNDGETEQVYQERLSEMKATDMTFGAGKRVCIGRNIAIIECHKIIASLVSTFDMTLVDPKREWKTHNAWLIRQRDMDVILKERRRGAATGYS